MVDFATGKVKMPIEIQHLDGTVTLCFVFVENPEYLYDYILSVSEFLPVMILSNEIVFIAKSSIKAFKTFDLQTADTGSVWSFDPYSVLGVDSDISLVDLHNHYINLLKQVHPDIVSDKGLHESFTSFAQDVTRRIISAYDIIRTEKEQL